MNKNYTKQIEELANKRETLRVQLAEIRASIESQTEAMGTDLLADKNTDKALEALTRSRGKADALGAAITQAGAQIATLETQQAEDIRQAAQLEYTAAASEAAGIFKECVSGYFTILEGLERYDALYKNMNALSHLHNFSEVNEKMFNLLSLSWKSKTAVITLMLEKSIPDLCEEAKR